MIATETTTVYRATYGRISKRFFSRHSAARWLAKQLIKTHCYCDSGDEFNPWFTCHYHAGGAQIESRLTRFLFYISTHPRPAAAAGPAGI